MRSVLTALACWATSLPLLAQVATDAPLWLRGPAISPDGNTIVFTYQGDLWSVPARGGDAKLLTTHEAADFAPVWSPDGQRIAFASLRHGSADVFVMPATGGNAQRLTFHATGETPSDFTPDGEHVLFYAVRQDDRANQQFPVGGLGELYQVAVDGGRPQRLLTTPAIGTRVSPDGNLLVFHDLKGYEDSYRKHHTSSVTRDIWSYDNRSKTYKQLTTYGGEDRNPVFSADGNTIYYLSEQTGSSNIMKMPVGGGTPVPVSALNKHPVRSLSISRNGTLCFSWNGELYTMTDGGTPNKVNVRIATDGRYTEERIININSANEMALSPNGKEVAFVQRGEVFVTSVEEGTTRRITNTPEQERSVSFSPDGRTLLYATERNGSWDLYTTTIARKEEPYFFNATILKEEPLLATAAEEFQPEWSPDGKEVAYLEERTAINVINVASKKTRNIVPVNKNYSYSDGDQYFSWSPDSKWLLVEFLHDGQWIDQCGLVSAEGGKPVFDLTKSGYGHVAPRWSADGKVMISFSDRDGMKNHASWGAQSDMYALFFTQEAFDKFKLNKEDATLRKEADEKNKEKENEGDDKKKKEKEKKQKEAEEKAKIGPLSFELDGIEHRRARLTIHSSNLSDGILSKDGEKIYYLASFEKGYNLWETDLRTQETKMLAQLNSGSAGYLALDSDGKKLFLLNEGKISYVDLGSGSVKGVGINGEMRLNENKERAYLFEHAWRQVVKKFYRVDLHGVDWDFYKKEYARFLPHINNNHDFAELLSEMLGELNASHTGAGFHSSIPNGDNTACLGAFYAEDPNSDGWRIEEVLKNGPLTKSGTRIKAGTVIESIDGTKLDRKMDPYALLNRKADKPTLLGLHDPATGKRWEETVKPIGRGEENELLYQRWVERCRFIVDSLSKGTVGYVHVRSMGDQSYRTVYDEALGRHHDKKALVVDTRFNGGGWLHDDLATFLSGKTYIRMEPRGQDLGSEPQFKWAKPSVVVMSESNYSDAHMFPVTYRALGIGKLVGMPVPGTGTAVWWERLQNGVVFGIPQVGMIDNAGNYLENQQLDPDVRQPLEPGVVIQNRDQQLEAAVKELLKG